MARYGRHGGLIGQPPKPIGQRLEKFSDRSGGAESCWPFMGKRDKDGYGRMQVNGKSTPAARVMWMHTNGPIAEGMFVCHKCDNPSCINPDHLFIGTPRENNMDKVRKNRQSRIKGENHGRSKLTDQQASAIKALIGQVPRRELAETFGVSRQTIGHIARGENWTHINGG